MKKLVVLLLTAAMLLSFAACGEAAEAPAQTVESTASAVEQPAAEAPAEEAPAEKTNTDELVPCNILLEGDSIKIEGNGAQASNGVITVKQAGLYVVSGTLNDGQILVDAEKEDEIFLTLSGANITCSAGAPVYIKKSGDVTLTLEGENKLADGQSYVFAAGEDEPDAALFSKSDLKIEGEGSLNVTANYDMGIHGKDDLKIKGGNITVNAVGDGVKGKDSVEVKGGSLNITAGGDGIQSNNDVEKGTVTVEDGVITVNAVGDGIKSESSMTVSGGTLNITAGGDGLQAQNTVGGSTLDIRGGSITVDAQGDGIQSDNFLNISGDTTTLNITSVEDGIKSDDAMTVTGGTLNIVAGGDGIQADNLQGTGSLSITGGSITIDAQLEGVKSVGPMDIADGVLVITSQEDGIQSDTDLTVSGGSLELLVGGGSVNAPAHTEGFGFPGWFNYTNEEDTVSAKGLKAVGDLTVSGGKITMDTMDDALHCGGILTVTDQADITISTGDDGLHSDDTLAISGGVINILTSYEGLEAVKIEVSGGEINLVSSDDGINAAGGVDADTDFAFMGPPMGFGGGAETLETATYYAYISGGILNVDAGGDGLDSNGALFIDGGTVTVSGPVQSMNGALDYTTTGQVSGGTVMILGTTGMAMNFDSSSTQPALMQTFSARYDAGTVVTVSDSSGTVLAEAVAAKQFNMLVASIPEFTVGETYTITCGTDSVEVTLASMITGGGFGMGGPGMGGPGGGMRPGGPGMR